MIRFYLGWDQHVKLAVVSGLVEMGAMDENSVVDAGSRGEIPLAEFMALPDGVHNGWVLLHPELEEQAIALHDQLYKVLWPDQDPSSSSRQAGILATDYERISNARSTTP